MKKRARSFLVNGALLAISTLILRFAGVAFNAYLTKTLGEAGMGLLTLTMSVYSFALTFSTSGINLASTRLCSEAIGHESKEELKKALRLCVLYALFFGLIGAIGLFSLAPFLARKALCDMRTLYSLRVLALSLPAIALSSALSGYFNALRRAWCNALNMVLTQMLKIALTAAFLYWLSPFGLSYSCCAVVAGTTLSEVFSLIIYVLLRFLIVRSDEKKENTDHSNACAPGLFSHLLGISLPVAFAAYARSGLVTFEHLLIPRGLKKSGSSSEQALASYGVVHGMALPVVLFPSAILSAFASLLIPELSEALAKNDRARLRRIASKVLRVTAAFSVGASCVLAAFGKEIGEALYHSADSGKYIRLFAILIPVMYFDTSTDAMLKGIGEQVYSMKVNILDAALSVVLVWLLIPKMGIWGYIIMVFVTEALNMTLSVKKLVERTGVKINFFRFFLLPILCASGAASASYILLTFIIKNASPIAFALAGSAVTLGLYYLFMRLSGAVSRSDIGYFKKALAK